MKKSKATTKLSKTQYHVKTTGEIKDISPYQSKTDNRGNTQQSYYNLAEMIHDNIDVDGKSYYSVFTYEDAQKDITTLNNDMKRFHRKLRKYYEYEYIQVPEPTENGVWHMNLLLTLDEKEYLDYSEVSKAWGKGRVETKKIWDVLGIIDYLCLDVTKNGEKDEKNLEKVQRLDSYPAGMKLYSSSSGIKKGETK